MKRSEGGVARPKGTKTCFETVQISSLCLIGKYCFLIHSWSPCLFSWTFPSPTPPRARILTIKRGMKRASLSAMSGLFATPWTVAYQDPLSLGFSRQECWSGLPCPPPGDLPDPEIKLTSLKSPALQEDSLPLSYPRSPQRGIGLLNCYKTMWKMSEDAGFREVATNAKSVNFLIWTIK